MAITVAELSAGISFAALTIAAYGIFERGKAARRSERIRLTSIIEELAKVRYELVDLSSKGKVYGDIIEVLHTRLELLGQQALSLIQKHDLEVTSSELRELAYDLEEAGFVENADAIWEMALENASPEGKVQELYATRGYAYFLFRQRREIQARELLESILEEYSGDIDADRLVQAQTLNTWAGKEIEIQGLDAPIVFDFQQRIQKLAYSCSTPRGRIMVMQHAFDISIGANAPKESPASTAPA